MTAEAQRVDSPDETVDVAVKSASYKKKQILVVILLIGLLIAIVTQPAQEGPASAQARGANEQAEGASTTNSPGEHVSESADRRQQDLTKIRELSRIELDEILQQQLFAAVADRPLRPKAINPTQRVQAIYGTSNGRAAALLGNSIVRGGQPLPDGGKVVNVTTDGIQVAR